MNKDISGPAFPLADSGADYDETTREHCNGMTLRDYFAAKAVQGWVSDLSFRDTPEHIGRAVAVSYRVADAMLAERAK
jgi:hypothetical protein